MSTTNDPGDPDAGTRESSQPAFWDERYRDFPELFSSEPSAFVKAQADRLPPGAEVLDVAAGEGRNARFLAERGHPVTAVDFAPAGLEALRNVAAEEDLPIKTVCADILSWEPHRQWDAIVITFLQLLPHERPRLFERLLALLRPGGWLIGVFFRPAHLQEAYADVGPPVVDRMFGPDELREYFPTENLHVCEERDMDLDEGRIRGRCALTTLVAQAPEQ